MKKVELDFLRESNNIEDEWDDKSLQDAILAWQFVKEKDQLTLDDILETHKILMNSRTTIQDKWKGKLREGHVWIGGKKAKSWYIVPELLDGWIERINLRVQFPKPHTEGSKKLCAGLIRDDHVEYEGIHPFFDGNGRTGRIFYNWERIKRSLPIHVIHVGKEQYEYYDWFF
jgi:Fic family protein